MESALAKTCVLISKKARVRIGVDWNKSTTALMLTFDSRLISDPPKNCSGVNEIWRTCFGGCDPTCREPEKKCDGSVDGCFCMDGYVRDENNYCIKKEECIRTSFSLIL